MTDTNNANTAVNTAPAQAAEKKEAPVGLRTILGEKLGMTQLFDEQGCLRAVSVIKAGPCVIAGVRTPQKDGYSAVCLGFGDTKKGKLSKPLSGQFEKKGIAPVKYLREVRLEDNKGYEVGQSVSVASRFAVGDYVDVQGVNKGHGFAGGMKRHNFRGLPGSHGASDKERSPGSLASRRSLGRVIPGQRMAGHMGTETVTIVKLEVLKVDAADNLIYVNGSVPGTNGGLVTIKETTRPRKKHVFVAPKADKKAKGAKPAAKPAAKK